MLDVSGMGRLIGTDESVPVAASYPSHPITQNFNLLTAYPLARSMTPIEGGTNGHTAQRSIETSKNSWGETDLKGLASGQPAKPDDNDKKGPVSLGAAVSAPATESVTKGGCQSRGQSARQEGGNADRRHRRFRLREQRGPRRPGQSRSVPQHDQLARAAGKSDLDPATRSRRPPNHVDGGSGETDLFPDRPDRARAHSARGRPDLVAEAVDAWCSLSNRVCW